MNFTFFSNRFTKEMIDKTTNYDGDEEKRKSIIYLYKHGKDKYIEQEELITNKNELKEHKKDLTGYYERLDADKKTELELPDSLNDGETLNESQTSILNAYLDDQIQELENDIDKKYEVAYYIAKDEHMEVESGEIEGDFDFGVIDTNLEDDEHIQMLFSKLSKISADTIKSQNYTENIFMDSIIFSVEY